MGQCASRELASMHSYCKTRGPYVITCLVLCVGFASVLIIPSAGRHVVVRCLELADKMLRTVTCFIRCHIPEGVPDHPFHSSDCSLAGFP